jgi:hypothetical protein
MYNVTHAFTLAEWCLLIMATIMAFIAMTVGYTSGFTVWALINHH